MFCAVLEGLLTMIVSLLVSIATPLVFLYTIWILELYTLSSVKFLLVSLVWGGIVFACALVIQTLFLRVGLFSYEQVTLYSAPILEDALKLGLLVGLSARMRLRYAAEGAAYGFAIGTGFALVENVFYLLNNPEIAFSIAVSRVLSTSLMHAFTTGLIGAVVGARIHLSQRGQGIGIFFGFAISVIVHSLFNQVAYHFEGLPLVLTAIVIGLGGTAMIGLLIVRSVKQEGEFIAMQLDGIASAGEVAAATNPQQIADMIAEHYQSLGDEKSKLLQRYVTLQSQRGILRKTLSLNQRQKFTPILQNQLQIVEQQLQALRQSMGLYTWVWLRSVLPSDESDLWMHLDNELDKSQPILGLIVELNQRHDEITQTDLDSRVKTLQTVKIFADLKREDLEDLALLLYEQHYNIVDTVVEQGAVDEHLYIVAEGELVASTVDEHDVETILMTYSHRDTFNELSMLGREPSQTTIMTLSPVRLFKLARPDLVTLIYAKPQVAIVMMHQFALDVTRQTALLRLIRRQTEAPEELLLDIA